MPKPIALTKLDSLSRTVFMFETGIAWWCVVHQQWQHVMPPQWPLPICVLQSLLVCDAAALSVRGQQHCNSSYYSQPQQALAHLCVLGWRSQIQSLPALSSSQQHPHQ